MEPAGRGRAAAQGGFWRLSVTHAAAREAAAEAAAAPGAAGTGRGARAPPGAGRLPHSLACFPTRGGAGLAPVHSRSPAAGCGSHGAGARSARVGALGAGVSGGGCLAFRSRRPGAL